VQIASEGKPPFVDDYDITHNLVGESLETKQEIICQHYPHCWGDWGVGYHNSWIYSVVRLQLWLPGIVIYYNSVTVPACKN
jgi:hypothetical protein